MTSINITVKAEGCDTDPTIADILSAISDLKETIMADQAALAAALQGVTAKLTEASTEINAKLAELQAAIVAAGNTTPAVDAALAEVQALATSLADVVPNP